MTPIEQEKQKVALDLESARRLWQTGQAPEAIEAALQVIDQDPGFLPAYLDLGSWLAAAEEFDAAINVYLQGLQLFPDAWAIREQLYLVFVATDKPNEAVSEAKIIAEGRGLATDFVRLAESLVATGNTGAAEGALGLGITVDPDDYRTYLQLAELYELQGLPTNAEQKYREASSRSPENFVPLNALGFFLMSQNRPQEAKPVLEKALQLAPDRVESKLNLALCLPALADDATAAKLAREVVSATPVGTHNHQEAERLLQLIDARRAAAQTKA